MIVTLPFFPASADFRTFHESKTTQKPRNLRISGFFIVQNATPVKAGAAVLMFWVLRPNTPDSAFDYDTAAGPHPPLRLRLGAPSPKGKALGAI